MALQSWERTRASRGVEEGHSRSFCGCSGKASFPSTSAGDLRELPMVPLIGEGCCGVGGASRDSAGLGAMEEGLIWRVGRNIRLPPRFGLWPQGPCRVGTGESCLVLSEEGNPACLSSCQGFSGPWWSCVWNLRVFPMMHGGVNAPSCCAFTHRVAFEEGSGPRVLLKSGPGSRGRSACGTTHVARLEFPCENGLILRCTGKAGNPL